MVVEVSKCEPGPMANGARQRLLNEYNQARLTFAAEVRARTGLAVVIRDWETR